MGFFAKRTKIMHPDNLPDGAYYTIGKTNDGGAERFAYNVPQPHPLLTQYGGFIPRRQMDTYEPQTVYQYNALPVLTIIPGFVSGELNTQGLIQAGDLHGSQNNVLANNSLFGGVQS